MKYYKRRVGGSYGLQVVALAAVITLFLMFNDGRRDVALREEAPVEDEKGNRFWISNYMKFHDANRHNRSARYAIFLPIKAGFGDNVKGMLNMFAYSVLTRRVFLIHSLHPYPLETILSAKAMSRFIYSQQLDGNMSRWVGHRLPFHYNSGLTPTMRQLLRSKHKYVAVHMSKAQAMESLISRLRSPVYKNVHIPEFSTHVRRSATKLLLDPSAEIRRDIKWMLEEFEFSGNPYIAVHARLGIDTGESRHHRFRRLRGKEKSLAKCLANHVKAISKSEGIRYPNVFVATDTRGFKRLFRRTILDVDILPRSTIRFMNVRNITHYNTKHILRSSIVQMHIENLLLANARHIVAFESGFADIAYLRGNAKSYTEITYKSCGV